MKRVLIALGFLGISLVPSRVSAITFTEIGGVDQQVTGGATTLSKSGSGTEADWVEKLLFDLYGITDVNYTQMSDSLTGGDSGNWQEVTEEPTGNLWAYDFGASLSSYTSFFLIKTGKLDSGYTHFLYENVDEARYAVIDLSYFGSKVEITKISHIGVVPEPASLSLLAVGLLVVGAASRKRARR